VTILVIGCAGCNDALFAFKIDKHQEKRSGCPNKLTYVGNLSILEDDVMDYPNSRFGKYEFYDREGVLRLFTEERFDIAACFAAESHVDHFIYNLGF